MLISEAYAQASTSASAGGDMLYQLPMIGMVIGIFYFVVIRPQTKKVKEQKLMIGALQKGDEITTTGGELGRVVKLSGNYIVLEIAKNVEVVIQKTAIQTLLPKGTLKSLEKE
ncbi:MAG: preprotein translocase subunit YajC [Nitrosospira sp.]|jgi:preprotein translocase subunit YajC|nr:preprotein translocase subunit YajC [Nitrosospira sp.]MDW7642792.1 preprotein translocase subunit YajC [Nitrosomonadaceae bacterium]MBI0407662.1 preprotein translocase subunit YajC [Nitrosospira sp.]MBI0414181.1 preprotein translocase subunit YajC [Nitrosospira sp.]MBI0415404.1 preprotein translocase subunit YajC [Nitrosospira sp.]